MEFGVLRSGRENGALPDFDVLKIWKTKFWLSVYSQHKNSLCKCQLGCLKNGSRGGTVTGCLTIPSHYNLTMSPKSLEVFQSRDVDNFPISEVSHHPKLSATFAAHAAGPGTKSSAIWHMCTAWLHLASWSPTFDRPHMAAIHDLVQAMGWRSDMPDQAACSMKSHETWIWCSFGHNTSLRFHKSAGTSVETTQTGFRRMKQVSSIVQ